MTEVEKNTELSAGQIDELLRWFSRQNRGTQLNAVSAVDLTRLILGIKDLKKKIEQGQAKRYERELETVGEAEKLRIQQLRKRPKKPSPKARKIRKRKAVIARLRDQGLGWRMVARYLEKYCQTKVNTMYLRKVCIEQLGIE